MAVTMIIAILSSLYILASQGMSKDITPDHANVSDDSFVCQIRGIVRGDDVLPIQCAEIAARYGQFHQTAFTEADGSYYLTAFLSPNSGILVLAANAPGYIDAISDSIMIDADTTISHDFVLARNSHFTNVPSGCGSLAGRVTDEKGEALPGASIKLIGGNRGGSSNLNGEYHFSRIPAGHRSFSASLIGYKQQIRDDVAILADSVINLDFRLEPSIVKIGKIAPCERPIFDKHETSNVKKIKSEDLEAMPVDDLGDVLKHNP